ncbi:MAG: GNAT family N-acetyltransferase [Chlamydiales bacterium]|nr:GNAT family N-acetyltransferase [Chlamydiales bacterium]
MMKFCFITPDDVEYPHELMLRWEVLLKPLGLPPGNELIDEEKGSLHLVAVEKKKLVGCVLFFPEGESSGKLHEMALSEEHQGRGFGRKLISTLEQALIKKGFTEIYLFAPQDKVGFYERMGYKSESELKKEKGVLLQRMNKRLQPA